MRVYNGGEIESRSKSDGSPVTLADAAAEAIILSDLARIAPGVPVVAEEAAAAGETPFTGRRFFLVDPLDGTREFLSRNGEFTVNIALIEDGTPVLGVVYAPVPGDLFVGDATDGARHATVADGQVRAWRSIAARTPADGGLDVLASRSHLSDETRAFIGRFEIARMVQAGSSLKFCRLAAGEADLYPRLGRTMEWDTAAADAVLRAAGGSVLTLDGRPLVYGKRDQSGEADFANPWFVACGRFDPFARLAAA
jgi:3'(2'),5'-bisphosphate nucleotidase